MSAPMQSKPAVRLTVALVLAAGLAARIAVAEYQLSQGRAALPDSELYWAYAQSIASGGDYLAGEGGARRTPGYPLLIALSWKLSGRGVGAFPPSAPDIRPVLYVQSILGVLTCWLVWRIAVQWEDDGILPSGAAMFGLLLNAFDPFATATNAWVLAETEFTTFFCLSMWLTLVAGSGVGRPLAGGLAAGAAVLARPSVGLFYLACVAIALVRLRFLPAAAFVVGMLVLLTPWWHRNYRVYGRFVPTTLNVGESLYDGWNPEADGGSNMKFIDREAAKPRPAGETNAQREVREDEEWKHRAIEWAKVSTGTVSHLAIEKFKRFWSLAPNAGEFRSNGVVVVCTTFSLIAFGSAVAGCALLFACGRWGVLAAVLGPAVYFCCLHAVFVSSVRYRVPAMPMFHVASGAGIAWLAATLRKKSV